MKAQNSVKAFIIDNNKLLVIKRSDYGPKQGIWEIPGGRINIGEDPFIGLKRETKEETNLDIEIIKPLNVRHFEREDNLKITMITFLCKALNKDVKLSKEHTEHKWMDLDNTNELYDMFKKEVEIFKKFEMHKYI